MGTKEALMSDRRGFLAGAAGVAAALGWADSGAKVQAAGAPTPPTAAPEAPLPGQTYMPQMTSAPFPDSSRANGHD
mgnify:CR=1 FL=1